MKLLIIAMLLMNFTKAEDLIDSTEIMVGDFEPYWGEDNSYGTYDSELEEIKSEFKKHKSDIKKQENEPNKITYKSNINDDAYKARKSCLMSEKTAEECDKLFPVVKKTFTTSYEFKNVEQKHQRMRHNLPSSKKVVNGSTLKNKLIPLSAEERQSREEIEIYNEKIRILMDENS